MKSVDAQHGIDHELLALCLLVLPVWARHLAHSRSQSEVAVTDMLSAFTELAPHLDAVTHGFQIERLYKGFQYQDRLNQMMTLLHDDMQRLQQALTQADSALDPAQWLVRLQAGYVMAEQHHLHAGAEPAGATTNGDDTTFF